MRGVLALGAALDRRRSRVCGSRQRPEQAFVDLEPLGCVNLQPPEVGVTRIQEGS